MKKTIISLIIIIIMLFTININVDASNYTYWQCDMYTLSSVDIYSSGLSNGQRKSSFNNAKECDKDYKDKPTITDKCWLKNGSTYDIYNARLFTDTYYSLTGPRNSFFTEDHKCTRINNVTSCSQITASGACDVVEACKWDNSICVDAAYYKSQTSCNDFYDKESCLGEGRDNQCEWSASKGCYSKIGSDYLINGDVDSYIEDSVKTTQHADGVTVETNCNGIFGDFQDDLVQILKIFRILAPIIVAAFSVYEYLLAVINKDADALKKCNSRLVKRLILMAVLFLLPSLVNLLLKLVGDNYGVCLNTK